MSERANASERNDERVELGAQVAAILGHPVELEPVVDDAPLPDATTKYRIRDDAGEPAYFVLCSSAAGATIVARALDRAEEIREALGAELGRTIPEAVGRGKLHGRSFAVTPHFTPLQRGPLRRLQKPWLRPRILRWLRDASARTVCDLRDVDVEPLALQPLQRLCDRGGLSSGVRKAADEALRGLESATWRPRHAFMHDDLWLGNILIDQRCSGGALFGEPRIIDWAGARLRGLPLYDFVRLGMSFGLRERARARELERYCRSLGVAPEHARRHLLLALAELGTRLERWPESSYQRAVEDCYAWLPR